MKQKHLYWIVLIVISFISCNIDREVFVVTEFVEDIIVEKDFFTLKDSKSYYWDVKKEKAILSNEKVTIKYEKMQLVDIVSELGYDSHKNNMSENPIISIYYNKENTTHEKAKSEIMDALYKKYRLNYTADVSFED